VLYYRIQRSVAYRRVRKITKLRCWKCALCAPTFALQTDNDFLSAGTFIVLYHTRRVQVPMRQPYGRLGNVFFSVHSPLSKYCVWSLTDYYAHGGRPHNIWAYSILQHISLSMGTLLDNNIILYGSHII